MGAGFASHLRAILIIRGPRGYLAKPDLARATLGGGESRHRERRGGESDPGAISYIYIYIDIDIYDERVPPFLRNKILQHDAIVVLPYHEIIISLHNVLHARPGSRGGI